MEGSRQMTETPTYFAGIDDVASNDGTFYGQEGDDQVVINNFGNIRAVNINPKSNQGGPGQTLCPSLSLALFTGVRGR
jgi:hypothetical protein